MAQITITLNFGKYRHCLHGARTRNFIAEQEDRFCLLEGEACTTGTMYFCNTYLEAQFVMSLENGVGLYSDEYADINDDSFVVVSKKPFKLTLEEDDDRND